jgi:cytochrome c-type biogenesis protein CcmE
VPGISLQGDPRHAFAFRPLWYTFASQSLLAPNIVTTKTKFGVGVGIIVATLGSLAYLGAKESKTYYHTIAELSSLHSSEMKQRIRVAGDVATGSIQRLSGRTEFLLVEQGHKLPVSYVGTDPLPDTFKDGAQALAEGHLSADGHFVAENVQAKCASKYEAAPTGTAATN